MSGLINTVTGAVGTGFGAVTGAVGTGYNAVTGAVGTGIGTVTGLFSNEQQLRKDAEKKAADALKAKQEADQDRANEIKQAAALKAQQEAEKARIAAEKAALDKDATQQAYKKKFDSIITYSDKITCKIKEYNNINFDNDDLIKKYKIDDYYYQLIKLNDGVPNRVRKIIQFFYENNPKFGETQEPYYKAEKELTLIITIEQDANNKIIINVPLNKNENIVESFTINNNISTFSEADRENLHDLVKGIMKAIKPINFYGDNTIKLNNKKMKIIIDVSNQSNGTNTKVGNSQAISNGLGNTLPNITSFIQFNGGIRKTRKNKKAKKSTRKNKQKKNKNRKTSKNRKTLKN